MKLTQTLAGCLSISAAFLCTTARGADEPTMSAAEIASRLSALRQDGTSYARFKMDVAGAGTLQLQAKARRSKNSSEVVYQVLWPKERKGEAVLLRKSGTGTGSGATFTPPNTVKKLGASDMRDSLFGSELAYEDVVDNFFGWSSQTLVGTETVNRVNCQVLESKPGGAKSIYGSVKTWVDTKRMVPMRVEKYSSSGQLVRRIDTLHVANDDNRRPIPANVSVRARGVTQIEGSKIRHDVTFSDREFTPEGLAEISPPKGSSE